MELLIIDRRELPGVQKSVETCESGADGEVEMEGGREER